MKLTPENIINSLKSNQPVIVEFTKKVENFESCLEENMKGKVISCYDTGDGSGNERVYKLRIDLSEFDGYNDQFFHYNYYDKNGTPCLNCKQADCYPIDHIETLYVSVCGPENIIDVFKGQNLSVHYQEYLKRKPDNLTYIEWLEKQLTTAYNHLVPSNEN